MVMSWAGSLDWVRALGRRSGKLLATVSSVEAELYLPDLGAVRTITMAGFVMVVGPERQQPRFRSHQ